MGWLQSAVQAARVSRVPVSAAERGDAAAWRSRLLHGGATSVSAGCAYPAAPCQSVDMQVPSLAGSRHSPQCRRELAGRGALERRNRRCNKAGRLIPEVLR